MKLKTFENMSCPVARSLERVGDWWNILILREAFYGITRFDDFQTELGIATSTLTRRLDDLVSAGLLERRLYCEKPPRHGYHLTPTGRDFRPVMLALMTWGNRHFTPDGVSVHMVDPASGAPVEPVLVDGATGQPLAAVRVVPGPAASDELRRKFERRAAIAGAAR